MVLKISKKYLHWPGLGQEPVTESALAKELTNGLFAPNKTEQLERREKNLPKRRKYIWENMRNLQARHSE